MGFISTASAEFKSIVSFVCNKTIRGLLRISLTMDAIGGPVRQHYAVMLDHFRVPQIYNAMVGKCRGLPKFKHVFTVCITNSQLHKTRWILEGDDTMRHVIERGIYSDSRYHMYMHYVLNSSLRVLDAAREASGEEFPAYWVQAKQPSNPHINPLDIEDGYYDLQLTVEMDESLRVHTFVLNGPGCSKRVREEFAKGTLVSEIHKVTGHVKNILCLAIGLGFPRMGRYIRCT